jgi:probable F420-dependent oxidoreductase
MQLAAVLPSADIGNDTAAVAAWAVAAEDLGYDRIIAYDHVLGAEREGRPVPFTGPYDTDDPFREPLTLFAYLAGITRRIGFMSGVMVLPQRQTALVAKQSAEVDLFSGGRLTLGVGIGWNYIEYETLGVEFVARGARLEEQVEVLRLLWSEPVVEYHGRYHVIDRAGIAPRPLRSIPIWFGGRSPQAIERAARIGDGVFFTTVDDESCRLAAHLRDGSTTVPSPRVDLPFGLAAQIKTALGVARAEKDIQRWTDVTGTQIAVDTMVPRAGGIVDRRSADEHIDLLARFAPMIRGE